jgi:Helix-turn-helix domain
MSDDTKKPVDGDPRVSKKACSHNNSTHSQRQRLLTALQEKCEGLTTIEIRKPPLDIMQPAARVHELKHKYGQPIITMDDWQETDAGKLHRVGRYVLLFPAKDGEFFATAKKAETAISSSICAGA